MRFAVGFNISAFFLQSTENEEFCLKKNVEKFTKFKKLSEPFLTCRIIVPTFDTKVTEYLCSGWVFFSSDKFRLFN